jgi:iron-sulfur cluster assembly accessory protein
MRVCLTPAALNAKPLMAYMRAMDQFRLTPSAAKRVAAILSEDSGAKALRVEVLAGGCSGFQYKFDLTDAEQPDDLVIEAEGARVFVDQTSLELLAGAELDYKDTLMGAHFAVQNPNATASCGCGTSFSVD